MTAISLFSNNSKMVNETEMRPRVCSFESRRAQEMRSLIERHGGEAFVAPSMQEVPLAENSVAIEFAQQLLSGNIDGVVFMTGVGARTLLQAVESRFNRDELLNGLRSRFVAVRGPKPLAVMREWKVDVDVQAPEPNTWCELLSALDDAQSESRFQLNDNTIAVQEYGKTSEEFYEELQKRGANVIPVAVYRWELPDDIDPLKTSIRKTIEGEFDVLMFTSANQLTNLLKVATDNGQCDEWIAASKQCLIASIGPTASATIAEAGLNVDFEPSHPKMGHLVRESLERVPEWLQRRREVM